VWPEERAAAELGMRRRPLDGLFFGKVVHHDLVRLADDRLWQDPAVASVVDAGHRTDLARLADAVPQLLRRVEGLPHGVSHGDATPDNLLEPGDGTVVAIDWSYGSCGPLGGDLAQLVAGRSESGALDPSDLADVADAVLDGYVTGLSDVGCAVDVHDLELAWATHLAVRSTFSALLLDHRPDLSGDERRELLARRAALGRFGVAFAARVLART
jgi:Ser/Thr protein kinase RdoA (MazF antagonist)